ncbi:carboxymuconolactone decarboxylase family protein [Pseudoponticoccus marisrubri]|uniref:Alkylhydroperoxidase n=1 Tax=Pseudoponticoccus marisrubri TaxID=1685382 RepID=A0A0W7WI51_9RHOB|nr:carboxymuconolactone decarboxylase family protein [Pseudoponticoccus marisrubri]KUF10274.1 alkylhydroperoxidase [Pseudoponticoccus marisrubri]
MSYKETISTFRPKVREFNAAIGETATGFGAIVTSLKGDGALDHKQKELIALGIAVAIRCEPCILFHVEALVRLGATRDEIAETLAVCVEMGGGPGVMYGTKALACFDELKG